MLVGVSGGPDSVCLLDILARLASRHNNRIVICHYNHHLRGEDSDADARFVTALADKYCFDAEVRSGDVRKYAREQKLSLEDAARVMRYDFFRDVAHELGIHKLALAHTADDQIETILLRFLRGAGLRGLAAMQSERKMRGLILVRPLLDFWKREVIAYVKEQKLEYRTDLSNFDAAFTRNRIRLELIPLLESEFNPNIRQLLHQTAEIVADDDRYLDELARVAYEQCLQGEALRIPQMILFDIALQRRIIRHWLAQLTVPIVPSFDQVDSICALTGRLTGGFGSVSLPSGKLVCRDYEMLRISDPLVHELLEIHHPVQIPGETSVPELGLQVKAEVIETNSPLALSAAHEQGVEYFDLEELGEAIAVRNWRAGDRYHPIGLNGTKKLHDIFVDEKVSAQRRHRVPLLVNEDGQICWVVGYRIAEEFKLKPNTRRVLRVRVNPLPPESSPQAPV